MLKKTRLIAKLISFFLSISWTISCSDSNEFEIKEPFVGKWIILDAYYDDVSQTNWKGLLIEIEQTNNLGGIYTVTNSPYDSIWKNMGSWNKLDSANTFNLDNKLNITYGINNDKLDLFFLSLLTNPTCYDSICLPVVRGQWCFKTEKYSL